MFKSATVRERFHGEITGFGTSDGHRVVIGRWTESPLGPFADVMHEGPDGLRTLHAPTDEIGEYIRQVYVFDDVRVGPITTRRTASALTVSSLEWSISVEFGRRTPLGWLLHAVPPTLATTPWWCTVVDPIARLTLRGVRTRGTARVGAVEWYGATDRHSITSVRAALRGENLGSLAPVHPPVRFGSGSVPKRPGVVSVVTTVGRDDS